MLRAWGVGHDSLRTGEAFRLLTGTFLSHDAGMLMRQLILVAITLKLAIAPHLLADGGHVLALLLGVALGQVLPLFKPR